MSWVLNGYKFLVTSNVTIGIAIRLGGPGVWGEHPYHIPPSFTIRAPIIRWVAKNPA